MFLLERKKKKIDIFIYRIQLYVGILNPTPYAKGRKNIKEDDSYENQSKWQVLQIKRRSTMCVRSISYARINTSKLWYILQTMWVNCVHCKVEFTEEDVKKVSNVKGTILVWKIL